MERQKRALDEHAFSFRACRAKFVCRRNEVFRERGIKWMPFALSKARDIERLNRRVDARDQRGTFLRAAAFT